MISVLLSIHILITITLVGTILLQRSEGGALGIGGGGGGGGGGLMSGRAAGSMLTKFTAGLAAAFMLSSIALAILGGGRGEVRSIVDQAPVSTPAAPVAPAPPSAPIGD